MWAEQCVMVSIHTVSTTLIHNPTTLAHKPGMNWNVYAHDRSSDQAIHVLQSDLRSHDCNTIYKHALPHAWKQEQRSSNHSCPQSMTLYRNRAHQIVFHIIINHLQQHEIRADSALLSKVQQTCEKTIGIKVFRNNLVKTTIHGSDSLHQVNNPTPSREWFTCPQVSQQTSRKESIPFKQNMLPIKSCTEDSERQWDPIAYTSVSDSMLWGHSHWQSIHTRWRIETRIAIENNKE